MEDESFESDAPKRSRKKKPEPAELPVRVASAPYHKSGEFEYEGGCWCGKKIKGCAGGPVTVSKWKHFANFTCPRGRPMVGVPVQVRGAARKAGIIE